METAFIVLGKKGITSILEHFTTLWDLLVVEIRDSWVL